MFDSDVYHPWILIDTLLSALCIFIYCEMGDSPDLETKLIEALLLMPSSLRPSLA